MAKLKGWRNNLANACMYFKVNDNFHHFSTHSRWCWHYYSIQRYFRSESCGWGFGLDYVLRTEFSLLRENIYLCVFE